MAATAAAAATYNLHTCCCTSIWTLCVCNVHSICRTPLHDSTVISSILLQTQCRWSLSTRPNNKLTYTLRCTPTRLRVRALIRSSIMRCEECRLATDVKWTGCTSVAVHLCKVLRTCLQMWHPKSWHTLGRISMAPTLMTLQVSKLCRWQDFTESKAYWGDCVYL